MKTKIISVLLLSVLFPLLLNSCDDQGDGNHYHSPTYISEMCIVKSDSSGFKVIGDGTWGDYTFLPNSNKILYTSSTGGQNAANVGLYIINTDGTGSNQLLGNEHMITWFSSSPDNKRMLVSASDGIYILDAEGEIKLQKIQADLQDVQRASFSHDMTKIVFQQNNDINLMDASGGNIKTIRKANDTTAFLNPGFILNDSLIIFVERDKPDRFYIKSYAMQSGDEAQYYSLSGIGSYNFFTLNAGKVIYGYNGYIQENDIPNFRLGPKVIAYAEACSITSDEKKLIYKDGLIIYMFDIDGFYAKTPLYKEIYSDGNQISLGKPALSADGKYILYKRTKTIW